MKSRPSSGAGQDCASERAASLRDHLGGETADSVEVFFADDSVQRGFRTRQGKLVGFGGIFVEDSELRGLSDDVEEIARRFRIPPGVELKWSPSRSNWIYSNLVDPDRPECYRQVIEAAAARRARALVAVVDLGRVAWTEQRALRECITYVWERIEMHLSRPPRMGLIVADRPSGGAKEEDALLADFLAMSSVGTGWVVPNKVALNLLTTSSHLLRHLQVADLVTGATVAAVGGSRWAAGVFPAVKRMLISNALGYAGGTGLKLAPRECVNLYYHVLGESAYTRASAMGGIALPLQRYWAPPRERLDYFNDDGLAVPPSTK
jgi:hypothetical protein